MILRALKAGDIIEADRRGRRFFAIVVERHERELQVEPIDRRVTYHHVKAREVIGIWHKSRARSTRAACPRASQPTAPQPLERRSAA